MWNIRDNVETDASLLEELIDPRSPTVRKNVEENSIANPIKEEAIQARSRTVRTVEENTIDEYFEFEHSFGRFEENTKYLLDPLEYERNGKEQGLVIVLNHTKFENGLRDRKGTSKDVIDGIDCMKKLGFNIELEHVLTDLTKTEIFERIDKIVTKDLSEYNALIIFVLTHGNTDNRVYSKTEPYLVEELWLKFEEAFKNKPKLVIIQACKGKESVTYTTKNKDEETYFVPLSTYMPDKLPFDMVVVFCTLECNSGFRDPSEGSWLIQEICRNFTAFGRREDVLNLMTRVKKCVCKNYYTPSTNEEFLKQMPVVVSTLRRKFYLSRNKQRSFDLVLLKQEEEIEELIKKITQSVAELHPGENVQE